MAKRESVATLKKQLAETQQKLKAARSPYSRPATTLLFEECSPLMFMKSGKPYPKLCEELCEMHNFLEMIEGCDPETVGYVLADAIRVGMEMGKRLHEAQQLEEMVGYTEGK